MLTVKEIRSFEATYKQLLSTKANVLGIERAKMVAQWLYFVPYTGELDIKSFTSFLKKHFDKLPVHNLGIGMIISAIKNNTVEPQVYDNVEDVLKDINNSLIKDKEIEDVILDIGITLEKDMVSYFAQKSKSNLSKDDFLEEANYRYGDTLAKVLFISNYVKKNYEVKKESI